MHADDANSVYCPIFHGMSLDERRQVLELLEHESYPADEVILREGNATQILWIIVRGRCGVFKTIRNGSEQELAILEPGGVFGEMSFFNPAPHSASVRTLTNVEVIRLSRERYEQLEQAGSSAALRIAVNTARVLAERLQKMDEWTCELVDSPAAAEHREEWREFRAKLYSGWEF